VNCGFAASKIFSGKFSAALMLFTYGFADQYLLDSSQNPGPFWSLLVLKVITLYVVVPPALHLPQTNH
jgi:uncharacterized membrane-anchored protein